MDARSRGAEPVAIDEALIDTGLVRVGRFRVAATRSDFASLGAITRHAFVFPRRAVWIRHAGSPAFVADPTRVTLYNPGAEYRREPLDPVGDCSDWFTVDAGILRDAIESVDPGGAEHSELFAWTHAAVDAGMYLRQRRIYEYVRNTPRPEALPVEEGVLSVLAEVVAKALRQHASDPVGGPRSASRCAELAEATCAVLNRTFWTSESLAAIAGRVGVSTFHLCRLFKRATGGTIHQHREQLRLRASLQAILESREDLVSIGLRLGYSSHSHFTAAFHRRFRAAPSTVRRLRRTGILPGELRAFASAT